MFSKKFRINYVTNIIILMLRYLYHHRIKKESFINIINNYTDIYRKLDLYDQKKNKFRKGKQKLWKQLIKEIKKNLIFSEKIFIKKSMETLSPFIKNNINKNNYFREFDTKLKFDPFNYRIIKKTIDLHVPRIGFYPSKNSKKFLKNKENRNKQNLKALYQLINFAQKKNKNLNMIQMGSWMNENNNFRSLFPKSWKKSKKMSKTNNLATWGQFIKYDGCINLNLKNKFIKNYKFPIKSYYYKCSINALRSYLKTKIIF